MGIKLPTPWKTLTINFAPPQGRQRCQMPGGILKLRFDRYIIFIITGLPLFRAARLSPAKTAVSPRSSPLGTFGAEDRTSATQRQKFHTDKINVYIIYPVVMGFHIQICSILRFSWSILLKYGVRLPTSSSKTQMLLLEKNIFHQF